MSDGDMMPQAFIHAGFSIIPCKADKSPAISTWKRFQQERMSFEQCAKMFTNGERIGVIAGTVSGNLECIDFDDPEVYQPFLDLLGMCSPELLEKLTLREKTPRGGFHIIYRSEGPIAGNLKLAMSNDKKVRIETRGEGGYFVSAPSQGYEIICGSLLACPILSVAEVKLIHETAVVFDEKQTGNHDQPDRKRTQARARRLTPGKQFNRDNDIADILKNYGWKQAQKTTAGVGWTRPGKHAGVSGVLLEKTGNFYVFSSNAAPLESGQSYSAFALYTAYEQGGDYSAAARALLRGGESRHEAEANDGVDEDESAVYIEEINLKHAFLVIAGKSVILNEVVDPTFNRPDVNFSSIPDFHHRYANRKIAIPDHQGNLKLKPISKLWLESPIRREYDGIVFDPSNKSGNRHYNLWRGFAVEPRQGSWDLMREHILQIICSGNEEIFKWVLASLARIVQDPGGYKPGTAIVLKGQEGTGKGAFIENFGRIFGSHFLHLTASQQLTGRFNSHFKSCLVCFADEATWGGGKEAEGVLKGLVTSENLSIEHKGKDIITLRNHVNLFIASNNDWIIPAGLEARRFCVLEVSDRVKQDKNYFMKLTQEANNGGLEAMLYDLLQWDISGVDLRTVPRTEALFDQIHQSMPIFEKFWYECLAKGTNCFGTFGEGLEDDGIWANKVSVMGFYQRFLAFADELHMHYRLVNTEFGKKLSAVGVIKKRISFHDDHGRRAYDYHFPPLDECRKQFEDKIGMSLPWYD